MRHVSVRLLAVLIALFGLVGVTALPASGEGASLPPDVTYLLLDLNYVEALVPGEGWVRLTERDMTIDLLNPSSSFGDVLDFSGAKAVRAGSYGAWLVHTSGLWEPFPVATAQFHSGSRAGGTMTFRGTSSLAGCADPRAAYTLTYAGDGYLLAPVIDFSCPTQD